MKEIYIIILINVQENTPTIIIITIIIIQLKTLTATIILYNNIITIIKELQIINYVI